jgi:hypothetical protein
MISVKTMDNNNLKIPIFTGKGGLGKRQLHVL